MEELRIVVLCSALLMCCNVVLAADECSDVLVSVDQFSDIFTDQNWSFPFLTLSERALCDPAKSPWWADFSTLPKGLTAAFSDASTVSHGIKFLPLTLSMNIEVAGISVQTESGKTILSVAAPKGYDAAANYNALFNAWYPFFCVAGDIDMCRKTLQPERLVLHVQLADINDRVAYEKALADELAGGAEASSLDAESASSITNVPWVTEIHQNADGSIRLTWNSETNGFYDIYYSQDLGTQSWQLAAIQIPSQGTLTQWSDYGGPGRGHPSTITARFYRVGLTLDSDGDGLPDAYELLVSNTATNLSDTNANGVPDGEEDFDGDGVLNVGEYSLMTFPYLADSDGDGVSDGPNATNSIAAGPDLFFDVLVRGKIRGDNQVGETNRLLQIPFVVYLTDTNGAPVANGSNVTFTASYPSGADATSLLSNTSDGTGNNGFAGQAQTSLTFGTQTGTYKVVADCGNTNFEFQAETVTALSVEFTDKTYQPSTLQTDEVIGAVAHIRATASGVSTGFPHVIGVKLTSDENSSGIVVALSESSPGSGVFVGSVETESLLPSGSSSLSLPSPNPNPVGGNSHDDGVGEDASADNAIESGSNYNDSDHFDDEMGSTPFQSRGKARAGLGNPAGSVILTKSFMKAAGVQRIELIHGSLVTTNYLENQADFLYYSGHGYHDDNFLDFPFGEFRPSDVAGGEWKKDLEIVFFAGCSVLDVTGDKWPSGNTNRPGKAWAKIGPTYFLGYEASAPGDSGGAPYDIIGAWYDEWYFLQDTGDPILPWGDANEASSAWNAAALDCSVSPKVAWHFTGTFAHTWTSVPESSW
jgi:hypothetical protein